MGQGGAKAAVAAAVQAVVPIPKEKNKPRIQLSFDTGVFLIYGLEAPLNLPTLLRKESTL
jgi:hypothetical protein